MSFNWDFFKGTAKNLTNRENNTNHRGSFTKRRGFTKTGADRMWGSCA